MKGDLDEKGGGWTECLCPPENSYVENPFPNVLILGVGAFGHECEALMNRVGALMRVTRACFLLSTLHHVRTQQKGAVCNPGQGPHQNPTILAS